MIPVPNDAAGNPPAVSFPPPNDPSTQRRGGKPTRRVVSSLEWSQYLTTRWETHPPCHFFPENSSAHHDAAGNLPAMSFLPRKFPSTPRRGGKSTRHVLSSHQPPEPNDAVGNPPAALFLPAKPPKPTTLYFSSVNYTIKLNFPKMEFRNPQP